MSYPVVLPKWSDPRLHLAATITSLQVIGQVGFHFQVSIAQILLAVGTCALLEMAIALRTQRVILWPASAMLTGNGVAFVLRVPGTAHGDWWSLRGWWIFVGTAAVALLSKYVINWRGEHVFNPSNIGLVICFLARGRGRADPLDFWWGPMSWWLGIALAVIVAGGFAILLRLGLLRVALGFWLSFAAGIGVLALSGHAMTARWHLGPITGFHLWWVLITSPEVLVFLFFMITDPKTAPRSPRARLVYAVSLGLLAAAMIAPTTTEFAAKVALLGALAVVCAVLALFRFVPVPLDRRVLLAGAVVAVAAFGAVVAVSNGSAASAGFRPLPPGALPPITILPSRGVETQLDLHTAKLIAHDLLTFAPASTSDKLSLYLEHGEGQGPPFAVAQLAGRTFRLSQVGTHWRPQTKTASAPIVLPPVPQLPGYNLTDVAAKVGIRFREGSFHFGVTGDTPSMMGGGVCWLDYNNSGWLSLYAVNNYTDSQFADWNDKPPAGQLFENRHGHFVNVTKAAGLNIPARGEGCVAADFNGDGYTDLFVSTATDDLLFWNNGNGTFTESARKSGVVSFGWHSGAAVADVNGDGRPDLFVAGYTDLQHPIQSSTAGFPTNYPGIRDELFLNEGNKHFREVGAQVGLDPKPYRHALGATFIDVNGDGRPDLYVANDEDPNQLYLNEPGGPLGFHFVEVARKLGVADSNAGMGVAAAANTLFVSNSRGQTNAAYRWTGERFADVRSQFAPAVGTNPAGWGDSWVDLRNNGTLDLVLANGEIPITNLRKDAEPIQVLVPGKTRYVDAGVLRSLHVNGRGLAAADYNNDGHVAIAVGTIGGNLLLLRNTSPVGHWLEVNVKPFSPGATVTVVAGGHSEVRVVQAGSSYLSSEDPRVHFGLGDATSVRELVVRYPDGFVRRLRNVRADRILNLER